MKNQNPASPAGRSKLKTQNFLEIRNLHAGVGGKEIIKGLNLIIKPGEVHALMGPNGSGKSTLANLLAGHPNYKASRGWVKFSGQNVLSLTPDERAKLGIFLAFQYPVEVTGVSLFNFLKTAYGATHAKIDYKEFAEKVKKKAQELKIDATFLNRAINEGFSGGEKKKAEILQMAVLEPRLAILDETDSGLDIDALKVVAEGINRLRLKIPDPALRAHSGSGILERPGILLVTHYFRILKYVKPDFVHVFLDGKIAKSGGAELANQLEEKGYEWVK